MSHRPDGELYQIFRNQFLSYSMYISKISLNVLVTLLCNNDLCIVLFNLILFSIQILFSFSSTTTRVAAYIDSELLEKDITWTLQLVGSFLVVFSYYITDLSINMFCVLTCALWSEGFQSWMWRGLTFLLPFLFLGHVSFIPCLLILDYLQ